MNKNTGKQIEALGDNKGAVSYIDVYTPSLLMGLDRAQDRKKLGVDAAEPLPFKGFDIWNAYELSWLNEKGKPEVAVAQIQIPASSPAMPESKSLKLYLNSFNQTPFNRQVDVVRTLESDLGICVRAPVSVTLCSVRKIQQLGAAMHPGTLLDDLDVDVQDYEVNPENLKLDSEGKKVQESLYSHLLKSNCPLTGQPDWASIVIQYRGEKIDRTGLLKYLISFRTHQGFHENCVERIYMDILSRCQPENLSIYAHFLRRGGIDINPFRSNHEDSALYVRSPRQ